MPGFKVFNVFRADGFAVPVAIVGEIAAALRQDRNVGACSSSSLSWSSSKSQSMMIMLSSSLISSSESELSSSWIPISESELGSASTSSTSASISSSSCCPLSWLPLSLPLFSSDQDDACCFKVARLSRLALSQRFPWEHLPVDGTCGEWFSPVSRPKHGLHGWECPF